MYGNNWQSTKLILLSKEIKVPLKSSVLLFDNFTLFSLILWIKYNPSFGGVLSSTSLPLDNPVTIKSTSPANREEITFIPIFVVPNESIYSYFSFCGI